MISVDFGQIVIFIFFYTVLVFGCYELVYLRATENKNCSKYKKQITDMNKALEKKSKIAKGRKKGIKTLQRKNSKLKQENECLMKKLCEEVENVDK